MVELSLNYIGLLLSILECYQLLFYLPNRHRYIQIQIFLLWALTDCVFQGSCPFYSGCQTSLSPSNIRSTSTIVCVIQTQFLNEKKHAICLSQSILFCLIQWYPDAFVFLPLLGLYFSFQLNKTLLCISTTCCLPTHLMVSI